MHVAARRRQNQNAVTVNELGIDADAVFESTFVAHIVFGHVVERIDFARVADPDAHAKVSQARALAARRVSLERFDGEHRLATAFDFPLGQAVWIRSIHARQMDEVHVGHLTAVMYGAPCSGDGVQMRRDQPVFDGLLKGFAEIGRKHLVFFA